MNTNKILNIFKIAVSVLAISLIASCTRLESFLKKEPEGTEFQKALTEEYKEMAVEEAQEYDWMDSQHFIDKGTKSAEGITTLPEDLETWDIPKEKMNELRAARASLMDVVTNKQVTESYPKIVAKAQASFDCWVQEQEENWQNYDIESCRQDFYRSMKILNPFMLEDPYTIYFAPDSYMVRAQGQNKLRNLAMQLKHLKVNHEIVVNGHTDTMGDDEYNMKLSKLRSISVKKLLVRYGVSPDKISVYAFGESDPSVSTKDEMDESRNRRVEIYINN